MVSLVGHSFIEAQDQQSFDCYDGGIINLFPVIKREKGF